MFWSEPNSNEHNTILMYIKQQRRSEIAWAIVLGVAGLLFLGIGIYAVMDGFGYSAGYFVISVVSFLIAGGFILSNSPKYKLVKNREYEVCRCRILSRSVTRTRYSTDRRVTVLIPSDGKQSTYRVAAVTYKKAVEDASALLVDYTRDHSGKREIPIDLVIPDAVED